LGGGQPNEVAPSYLFLACAIAAAKAEAISLDALFIDHAPLKAQPLS
jgi:hypothetical protein